jgi:hypothetical protein
MNKENKLISVKKADFIKILNVENEDRVNILENPEYKDKILVIAGGEVFKRFERMKLREKES